jgi:hypothetical protein
VSRRRACGFQRLAPAEAAQVKPGRNDACPCGSGKKYKKCCGQAADVASGPVTDVTPVQMGEVLGLINAKRYPEVERAARELLRRFPDSGWTWKVLWMQGKDAQSALEMTAKLLPGDAEAHDNLGTALRAKQRPNEALHCFRRALEIRPDYTEAHSNLGSALRDLGRLDEAAASYRRALDFDPSLAVAHSNLGDAQLALGQIDEAIASCRRALAHDPRLVEAHNNLALALLLTGDFDNGWIEYEWRLCIQNGSGIRERRQFRQPRWQGPETLVGKTILIYGEQGLGDTLQFCRYLPHLVALGARVVFEVQPPLGDLLARVEGISQLITRGETLPELDYRCPLLSLPMAFKTTLTSIPCAARYLTTSPAKVAQWRARLGERRRPRVGLAWSGNPDHRNDQFKRIALAQMSQYLPDGFDYYCLQKDLRAEDAPFLRSVRRIEHFSEDLDFESTAALCECLDVVISVDTSVAHLSGALGLKTWVLLPFVPDWRWLLHRDDTPWYPTVKLYRQDRLGDWRHVLDRVAADLSSSSPMSGPTNCA